MKRFFLATMIAFSLSTIAGAQEVEEDVDIEFGFEDVSMPAFTVLGDTVNTDGNLVLSDGEFFTLPDGNSFTDFPGFLTPVEEDETLLVNEGDRVSLRFLDASDRSLSSVGAGFVNFFDPTNPSAGLQNFGNINIVSDDGAPLGSQTINLSASGASAETIILADGAAEGDIATPPPSLDEEFDPLVAGQIHTHLVFDLLDETDTPAGALGFLVQFEADLFSNGLDGSAEVVSDEFFLVFNNGLSEEDFAASLSAFGVSAVPEPSSAFALTVAGAAIFSRRRRRL